MTPWAGKGIHPDIHSHILSHLQSHTYANANTRMHTHTHTHDTDSFTNSLAIVAGVAVLVEIAQSKFVHHQGILWMSPLVMYPFRPMATTSRAHHDGCDRPHCKAGSADCVEAGIE